MRKEINDQWELDENGYVTHKKVVDCFNLNKTELYNRAMDYFVHNYGVDIDSVIQNRDVVNGIISCRGIFIKVHAVNDVLQSTTVDTWYILKVEVKDGKARITLSLTQYDERMRGGELPDNHYLYPISAQYPFNPNGYQKSLYEQAFHKSNLKALETIASVEKALQVDSMQKKNDSW
jgi:hypothetical protein